MSSTERVLWTIAFFYYQYAYLVWSVNNIAFISRYQNQQKTYGWVHAAHCKYHQNLIKTKASVTSVNENITDLFKLNEELLSKLKCRAGTTHCLFVGGKICLQNVCTQLCVSHRCISSIFRFFHDSFQFANNI